MKKILTLILSLVSVLGFAQSGKYQDVSAKINYKEIKVETLHISSLSDTLLHGADTIPQLRLINGTLKYYYNHMWHTVTGSGGGDITSSQLGDSTLALRQIITSLWGDVSNKVDKIHGTGQGLGYLYNWYAAVHAGGSGEGSIAPIGWHVPSAAEYWTLCQTLQPGVVTTYNSTIGGKLKLTDTTYWTDPNTGATNSSGFNLKGAGIRLSTGDFQERKNGGYLANIDAYDATNCKGTYAYFNTAGLRTNNGSNVNYWAKKAGVSIRLIKDDSNNPGSMVDIDLNVYPTVKIGNQVWMAENLRVTHYNDGSSILKAIDNTTWTNNDYGAYCAYAGDETLVTTGDWRLISPGEVTTISQIAAGTIVGYVPNTVTINGYPLTSNINISAASTGAVSKNDSTDGPGLSLYATPYYVQSQIASQQTIGLLAGLDSSKANARPFKQTLPSNHFISFTRPNTEITPFQMSTDLYIRPDTTGAISGGGAIFQALGCDGCKIYHRGLLKPEKGYESDTVINTLSNRMYTFIEYNLGSGRYKILGFSVKGDTVDMQGAPVTLSAPGSFTATAMSQTQINLTWSTVAHASSYKLEWSPNGTNSWTQIGGTMGQEVNAYDNIGLTYSTPYYYRLSSIGDGTNYLTSGYTTANATTSALSQLSAPSVSGSSLSTTSLRFSWSNVTHNSGYQIKISTNNGSSYGSAIDLATNTTSYDITGLTTGTRRDVQVLAKGDGSVYSNSNWSTNAYATTSDLTTLTTPTLNSVTVVDSTQINLSCASNISNNSGYDWTISRDGGSNYTALAHTSTNTYTYNFTTGHKDSTYYFKVRATGDLSTYNHSAYSSAQSGTTWGGYVRFVSAYTSTTGDTVHVLFNRAMQTSPSSTGFTFSNSSSVSSITRHSTNSSMYDIVLGTAYTNGATITMSYTPGTVTASDNGLLYTFSSVSVTNNTAASSSTAAIEAISGIQALFVAESNSDFTFVSGTNINTWKSRVGTNISFTTNSTSYTRQYDSSNKKVTCTGNGTNGGYNSIYNLVNMTELGTGDFTIVLYEHQSIAAQKYLLGGNAGAGRPGIFIGGNTGLLIYANTSGGVSFNYTDQDVVRKHVITRTGSTVTWKINGTSMTVNTNSITTSSTFNSWAIGNYNNPVSDFFAIAIFNKVISSEEETTTLNTLNTVENL